MKLNKTNKKMFCLEKCDNTLTFQRYPNYSKFNKMTQK